MMSYWVGGAVYNVRWGPEVVKKIHSYYTDTVWMTSGMTRRLQKDDSVDICDVC